MKSRSKVTCYYNTPYTTTHTLQTVLLVHVQTHVVHVQLGPKWRDIHTKFSIFFFLQMVNGSAFKFFEHEQYYVFVNICKRFKVLENFEQFTIPGGQRIGRDQKRRWALGKGQRGTANLLIPKKTGLSSDCMLRE